MSLGLSAYHNSGADFAPRVEYNAKAGRMSVVNRTPGIDGGFATDKVDVTMDRPSWALDIGSIEIGWMLFPPGTGPTMILVPFGEAMPERPDRSYKAGFKVQLWDGREPIARRFASNAGVVVQAIEELWDETTATVQAASGDIPVVQLVNVLPVRGASGTNYAPVFAVIKWIQRDERIFGPRTVPPIGGPIGRPSATARQPAPAARAIAIPAPVIRAPAAAWDAAPAARVPAARSQAAQAAAPPADDKHPW